MKRRRVRETELVLHAGFAAGMELEMDLVTRVDMALYRNLAFRYTGFDSSCLHPS